MSEFNAAFGLTSLRHFDEILAERRSIREAYVRSLSGLSNLRVPALDDQFSPNNAYFPVLLDSQLVPDIEKIRQFMFDRGISLRRYFYPLLTDHEIFRKYRIGPTPTARAVSDSILCLPIYPGLSEPEVSSITTALEAAISFLKVRGTHK